MMLWIYANQLQWEESAEWIIDHKAKSENGVREQNAPFKLYLHIIARTKR